MAEFDDDVQETENNLENQEENQEKTTVNNDTEVPYSQTENSEEVINEAVNSEIETETITKKTETEAVNNEPEKTAQDTANPDFDWEKYESGEIVGVDLQKEELEKIYDRTLSTISEKEVIDGTVISINKREVVINIGFKSDGIVSRNEFRYNPDLQIGDKVEVYVENQEDKKGQLELSHKKARALRSWDRINEALEGDEIIKGFIKCRTKGGMIVDVFGIEAFLPGSQIDVKPIRDYDIFVGKTMEFKVVKINSEFKNVVVSHKALIEAELEQQKKEIISKLEKGQILEGTVKNITSYGVFIDLGGVDGLIHITDLSWGRVNHPEEIVQLDQKINVVILDFDDEKKRIALGLKQLTPHPWDALDPELKVGDSVKGKVVVMADYGAFVEIATGVEGLIHVSEMSWSQHLRSAQDFFKVGDEIEAMILTLDREERKMSMGIKQLKSDPWGNIDEKFAIGTKHTATIRNFTNFGVFVEIEEGIDGLIHISDLSWTKKIKHPAEFTSIGENIEVIVLEIDKENRRLSLGHKQLEENPWDVFETIFLVDSVHEGTIIDIFDKGALIALPYGIEGFATPRHLTKADGSFGKIDEKLQFKVIEFNKTTKRIILSHTKVVEDERKLEEAVALKEKAKEEAAVKKRVKKLKDSQEKTTLGDITDLAVLKEQIELVKEKPEKKKVEKKKTERKKKTVKETENEAAEVTENQDDNVAEVQDTNVIENKVTEIVENQDINVTEVQDTNVIENKVTEIVENQDIKVIEVQDTNVIENKVTEIVENKNINVNEVQDTDVIENKVTEVVENQDIKVIEVQDTDVIENQIADTTENQDTNITENQDGNKD